LGLGSGAQRQLDRALRGDRAIRAKRGDRCGAKRGLGRAGRLSDRTGGGSLRKNRGFDRLVHLGHAEHPTLGSGLTGDFNEGHSLSGMEKLLVVRDGNPLLGRLVVVLRIIVGIFSRIKTELHRWRRCIIDGELEVRIAVRIRGGLEPD
jgi:hypothetical protein